MLVREKILVLAVLTAGVVSFANTVYAGGFLADTFVKPFSPQLAKEFDKKHAEMGNPLDHAANAAAGAAANVVVPGSGPAVTGALEAARAAKQ
jgi:hypothetical protein